MALLVEMGWGGLVQLPDTITWTDVSRSVSMTAGVTINRGASDEVSEIQPGTASLTVNNRDGAFTPGNSDSPYYPFVRRNVPIRIGVTTATARSGAAPWPLAQLVDDFDDDEVDPALWASVSGGTQETGGRIRVPLTPGAPAGIQSARQWKLTGSGVQIKFATVPTARGSSAASVMLSVTSTTAGTRIAWKYDAVNGTLTASSEVANADGSAVTIAYSPIDHAWLRIREAAGSVRWETSDDGTVWTVRRTAATPAWVGAQTQLLEIAATRTGGTGDYAEFDLIGHQVQWRFWGQVNDLPVSWTGLLSSVTVTATDLFKRLNRLPPLKSALAQEILLLQTSAYYPLTEPSASVTGGDLSGDAAGPLAIAQAGAGGTLDFATADGPPATNEQLPLFTPASTSAGKYLTTDMGAAYQAATGDKYNAMEAFFVTSTPGRVILALSSIDADWKITWSLSAAGALQAETVQAGNAVVLHTVTSGNLADGVIHHFAYDERTSNVYVDGVLKASSGVDEVAELRTLTVGGQGGTRLWSGTIGHVALYAVDNTIGAAMASHYAAGANGFEGETADVRISRLVSYAGINSVTILGSTHDPIAGQGEGGTGALARMQEVEATESGRLYAERDYFGLAYQSRDVRYNPDPASEVFVIDYADLDTLGVELADDDQKLVNGVTASRPGGATQRITAPASVFAYGPYEQDLTILKTSDNSVLDAGYWLVSRYADPDPELREVPVEAFTMPIYSDILDADISDFFTVYDLPPQAPAAELRVYVEGYTETIKEQSHMIQFRTSRADVDSVWVLEDPQYGALGLTTRLAY